jgi:hypothetical protein
MPRSALRPASSVHCSRRRSARPSRSIQRPLLRAHLARGSSAAALQRRLPVPFYTVLTVISAIDIEVAGSGADVSIRTSCFGPARKLGSQDSGTSVPALARLCGGSRGPLFVRLLGLSSAPLIHQPMTARRARCGWLIPLSTFAARASLMRIRRPARRGRIDHRERKQAATASTATRAWLAMALSIAKSIRSLPRALCMYVITIYGLVLEAVRGCLVDAWRVTQARVASSSGHL